PLFRTKPHAHRPGVPALRKRASPPVWRDRADRFLSHRGARSAWPPCNIVCIGRLEDLFTFDPGLQSASPPYGAARRDVPAHLYDRTRRSPRIRLRYHSLAPELLALPRIPSFAHAPSHHDARALGPPRAPAALRRIRGHAGGLGLARATSRASPRVVVWQRPAWSPQARPAVQRARRRRLSRIPRADFAGEASRSRHRDRPCRG